MPIKSGAFAVKETTIIDPQEIARRLVKGKSREEMLVLAGAFMRKQVGEAPAGIVNGPATPDELWSYIVATFGVRIARVAVCDDHDAPFDFFCAGFFEWYPNIFSIASRGSGKSFGMALLHLLNSRHKPGCRSSTYGAVEEQAKKVYQDMVTFFLNRGLPDGESETLGEPSQLKTIFKMIGDNPSSEVNCFPATLAKVNGPHPPKAHSDEVELMREGPWKESRNLAADAVLPDGRRIKAQNYATSTMKWKNGRVHKILKQFLEVKERATKQFGDDVRRRDAMIVAEAQFYCFISCIFESAEQVPNCRRAPENANLPEFDWNWDDTSAKCGCVVVETKIAPNGDFRGGYRRNYKGPVVDLVTASGKRLSITPNHPVLTRQGWVPAGEIKEGDHVVSRAPVDPFSASDFDQVPPAAEDVFASLLVDAPSGGSHSISPLGVDFHGDGLFTEGEVEFVSASDHDLLGVGDSSFVEQASKGSFAHRNRAHDVSPDQAPSQGAVGYADLSSEAGAVFPGDVSVEDLIRQAKYAVVASQDSYGSEVLLERRRGDTASLRDGPVGLAGDVGVDHFLTDPVSDRLSSRTMNTELFESESEPISRGTHLLCQPSDGLSCEVAINELVADVDVGQESPRNSSIVESTPDHVVRDSERSSDRAHGLAGSVALDEVIECSVREWTGQVFNFSTSRESYSANGIIVHNCSHVKQGFWDGENGQPGSQRTLEDCCRGKLYRSRGHRSYGEVRQLFIQNDRATWEAQQECREGDATGVYVQSFHRDRHGIQRIAIDPANGPIFTGTDWGDTNPACVLWVQYLSRSVSATRYDGTSIVMPKGSRLVFSELYVAGITSTDLGKKAIVQEVRIASGSSFYRIPVRKRWADIQGAGDRRDWKKLGLRTYKYSTRNFEEHVKEVRGMYDAMRAYVVIDDCPHYVDEIESWRADENGNEVDVDTHAMSSGRYVFWGMHDVYDDAGAQDPELQKAVDYARQQIGSSGPSVLVSETQYDVHPDDVRSDAGWRAEMGIDVESMGSLP